MLKKTINFLYNIKNTLKYSELKKLNKKHVDIYEELIKKCEKKLLEIYEKDHHELPPWNRQG